MGSRNELQTNVKHWTKMQLTFLVKKEFGNKFQMDTRQKSPEDFAKCFWMCARRIRMGPIGFQHLSDEGGFSTEHEVWVYGG